MRTFLRPTGFVDSPFDHDGKVARLAGGMLWFSQVEVIGWDGAKRTSGDLVPVERVVEWIADRPEDERLAWDRLTSSRAPLELGARTIRLDQPQVMGILNVTPDSFSDGGRFEVARRRPMQGRPWRQRARRSSTLVGNRRGRARQWSGRATKIERAIPVIRRLAGGGTAVSADTRKAEVMRAAIEAGAGMINDVSALTFDRARSRCSPRRASPLSSCTTRAIRRPCRTTRATATSSSKSICGWRKESRSRGGGDRARADLVDPGFGFGKTVAHNLELTNGLALFHGLGCPVVLGASRKRTIPRSPAIRN